MPSAPPPASRYVLWLVAVGFFMQTLDATIVNTALPRMAASLGESPLRMQSVVIAYALTMATVIPASGWLADRFGTRRIFTAAIGLFVAGSLACAVSANLGQLVTARVLQVSMGFSPSQSGMMMLPVAAAAIASKRLVPPLILGLGYRRVLVGNTVVLGMAMAGFALFAPAQPTWTHVLVLALFGAVNSIQFTAMNTVTLKDLDAPHASAGNGLLSMVQMLSMSLGVSMAGALLAVFAEQPELATRQQLGAFHATFLCVGAITMASAWIFWQLVPDADRPAGPGQRPVTGLD
ncbi:MFS transporter [Cognatazoarcus halotolerans]|uniref:MFS transporter n=1 Tax=Cognatazoarcus halotolerans TaxID=2686016 RepID=UPI00190FAB20|nr:MFS transporter [Cognatazoarcus halotolerans]MCB1899752.1 MFS transporter [Rhodocyclaceae bacterium]